MMLKQLAFHLKENTVGPTTSSKFQMEKNINTLKTEKIEIRI